MMTAAGRDDECVREVEVRVSDLTAVDSAVEQHSTQPSDPPTAQVQTSPFVELPAGSIVGDTYEIDAKLGAGAMGEVYAARHMRLGKRVAIKVIKHRLSKDSAAIERFAMEARTLAQIQHPSIVAVEHVGELADGRAYFVMEFLRGESLLDRLQRGRLPQPEALRVLDQMARGLDAAHGQGVTHRDLKPENTFLVHLPGEPPAIKLLDFGLAKLEAGRVDLRAECTQSGVAIGTPMYMSPEQARGPDVDYRTDIYALGCVAFELILGTPPFPHARTAPEFYAAHLHEKPPLPRAIWPEIPPPLDLCLFAMLAKDPAHRPTLEQVRAVIASLRPNDPARRATVLVRPLVPRSRRSLVLGAIAVAIVASVAIKSIGSGPRTPPPAPATTTVAHPATVVPPAPTSQPPTAPASAPTAPASAPGHEPSVGSAGPPARPARRVDTVRPRPRAGSGSASAAIVVPAPAAPAVRVEAPEDTARTTPAPVKLIDRNQTINPFAKHQVHP